jgi:hypothetical protein
MTDFAPFQALGRAEAGGKPVVLPVGGTVFKLA